MKTYTSVRPAVNQVELHPWCQQRNIADYCQKNGILVEAYCPIRRGDGLRDPPIVEIAKNNNATPAQVLIRWSIQKGYIPLPKSDNPDRIKENARVFHFELGMDEMDLLDGLDEGLKGAIVPQSVDCP
jgi:diketogulonate reductase-like aldo/keto reductase